MYISLLYGEARYGGITQFPKRKMVADYDWYHRVQKAMHHFRVPRKHVERWMADFVQSTSTALMCNKMDTVVKARYIRAES